MKTKQSEIDVQKVIERFGGRKNLIELITDRGQTSSDTRIPVWITRNSIPNNVLVKLMLLDPEFDPRQYGWKG